MKFCLAAQRMTKLNLCVLGHANNISPPVIFLFDIEIMKKSLGNYGLGSTQSVGRLPLGKKPGTHKGGFALKIIPKNIRLSKTFVVLHS